MHGNGAPDTGGPDHRPEPAREGDGSTAVLEACAIQKWFGGVQALKDVSLTVHAGEIVALLGDNGAGKSTLMRCISGEFSPDGGTLKVSGETVEFREPSDARRYGIETVYQDLALANDLSVEANLFLGREATRGWGPWRHLDNKYMERYSSDIVSTFGITIPSVRSTVNDLSGGQRQGVAIGRAVGWGSSLILLDEPTAALGIRERGHVTKVILGLKERGLAVIIVSHHLDEVFELADRIYVLRHGRIVGHFHTSQTTPEEMLSVMSGVSISSTQVN